MDIKNITKVFLIPSSFLLLPFCAQAQQDSTWTMTLERDFAPIVHQTDKIDRTPEIEAPVVNRTPVTYATWQAKPSRKSETGNLPFGQIAVERTQDSIGWIDANLGYPLSGNLDAYAHYKGWSLDLGGSVFRNWLDLNHVEWQTENLDYRWRGMLINAHARVGYDHTFDPNTFNEYARIRAHAGVEGAMYDLFDWSVDGSNALSKWVQSSKRQRQKAFSFFTDFTFDYGQWSATIEYNNTQVWGPMGSEDDLLVIKKYDFDDVSHYIGAELNWYGTQSGNLRFGASLPLGVSFGNWEGFKLKPTIHLSYLPYEDEWRRFFLDGAIGWNHTSLSQYLHHIPFLTQPEFRDKEFDLLDVVVGWEDNEQGYLKYKLWASIKWAQNELGGYIDQDLAKSFGARIRAMSDDNLTIRVGGNMQYEYNRYFRANLDLAWVHESSEWMIHEPAFEAGIHFLSSPTDRLDFDLGFDGDWKIEEKLMTKSDQEFLINMGDRLDLNFRADYHVTPSLSFYVYGNNLLNRKYDLCPLIPSQRINGHLGLKWLF